MKKLFTLLLTLILALSLVACGGKKDEESISIAVPNDTTNEARALLILENLGIIKLKDGAGITATHNTDLMSNDLLRPDCYFILENNSIKAISELTEKELRQAHNLQKMYQAGAFNAR